MVCPLDEDSSLPTAQCGVFPVQLWAGGETFRRETHIVVRTPPTKEAGVTAGCIVAVEGVENQENFRGEVSQHGNLRETIEEAHLGETQLTSAD